MRALRLLVPLCLLFLLSACANHRAVVRTYLPLLPSGDPVMENQAFNSTADFRIFHPYLKQRIEEMERLSPSFHEGMNRLHESGYRVDVMTPQQATRLYGLSGVEEMIARPLSVGQSLHFHSKDAGVAHASMVLIHLDRIQKHTVRASRVDDGSKAVRAEFVARVDAILAHELFGHVMPVAFAGGDLREQCEDPRPGQPALRSCVLQRENLIRSELGLAQRRHYEIDFSRREYAYDLPAYRQAAGRF